MRLGLKTLSQAALLAALAAGCAKQAKLPVAKGLPDKVTVATGQQVTLDATASVDSDGKPDGVTAFEWTFKALPPGSKAQIESPHAPITRFTPDVPSGTGDYTIQLVVSTKYYASEPVLLHVTVLDCGANAPVAGQLSATPAAGNIDQAVALTAPAAKDPDNTPECLGQLKTAAQTLKYGWKLIDQPAGSKAHLNDPAAVAPSFIPDTAGQYTAQLVLTDSTGRDSVPAEVQVQVAACGGASPVVQSVAATPTTTPRLGQATQLTPTVTDSDANAPCSKPQRFTYAWKVIGLPVGSHAQLNDSTVLNPSFTPDVAGAYLFRVVATDQTGRASAPVDVTVVAQACGSNPPNPIVSFSPGSVGIGTPVALHATPQDDDALCGLNQTFAYTWSLRTAPSGSRAKLLNPHGSDASFVPDVGGDYAVEVSVLDSGGISASAITHVTVRSCGANAPTIDALQNFPLAPLVGQAVQVVQTVSDVDSACPLYDAAQTFHWTFAARPPGSSAAIVNPAASIARFTPDVAGTYQVQLTVTDATGLTSAPALLALTTSTCGQSRPTILATGVNNATPDPGRQVSLFVQTDDVDNGGSCLLGQGVSVLWHVTSRPAGSGAALSDPTSAHPLFTPDKVGSYQFQVVATDSTGLKSDPAWVTLSTTSCGTAAPSVAAAPASISISPLQSVQLSATPSDADTGCGLTQTFRYAWHVDAAPLASSAVLSDPTSPAPSFKPDAAGDYLLSVTVTDSSGRTSAAAYTRISVSSCESFGPVIGSIAPLAPATLGNAVTLQATGVADRNCVSAGPLTYAWSIEGQPLSSHAMLDNPAAQSPKFVPDVAGSYQLALRVTSQSGLTSLPAFATVTVASCGSSSITWNGTPIVTTVTEPDGTTPTQVAGASVPGTGSAVALTAQFTDSNSACGLSVTPFTYRWALVSRPAGSAAALSDASAKSPAFIADVVGSYQVAAQIVDALGTVSSTQYLTVTTTACGTSAPTVAISASSLNLNTFATQLLQVAGGTASSPDDVAANCPARFASGGFDYAWSLLSGSASLTSTGGVSTTFSASAAGSYTVQLVATAHNSGKKSAPATAVLTVGACGSHAPVIASVSTRVGSTLTSRPRVGDAVKLTAAATDADNVAGCTDSVASYEWSVKSAPAGSAVTAPAPSSLPDFNFTADVAGTFSFEVVAVDSRGLRSQPWPVSVTTAVCVPVITALNASTLVPAVSAQVSLSVAGVTDSCVASPSFGIAWKLLRAPKGSAAVLSAMTGGSITFTPDVLGAYQIQAVATDNAGFSSDAAVVTLSAGTCGQNAPTLGSINALPATPDAGDITTLTVPVTDNNLSCAAGRTQPYRYQWALVSQPRGSAAALTDPSAAAPGFVADVPGSYQFSVSVVDALGNSAGPAFFTLATSACGSRLPVAAISPQPGLPATQLQTPAQQAVALTGAVTDADDACAARFHAGPYSQAWSVIAAPIGSHPQLSSVSGAATTFQADLPGSYLVQLIGRTAAGVPSAPATVSIAVSSCGGTAPAVTAIAPRVGGQRTSRPAVGATVTLTATAVDPDNVSGGSCGASPLSQTVLFQWTALGMPAGNTVTVPGTPQSAPITFVPNVAGTYNFQVVAIDSTGLSSAPFTIAVPTGPCGPGLTSVSVSNPTPSVGQAVTTSHLPASIQDSCVSNGALSYLWSVTSRPAASGAGFANPSLEANTFTPDVPGPYELQLLVTDVGGFATTAVTTLIAGGCAAGPTVAANAISVSAFEPDGSASGLLFRDGTARLSLAAGSITSGGCGGTASSQLSYEWSLVSRPAGSSAQLSGSNTPAPSFVADVAGGSWQVLAIVRDGLGNAAAPVFATVTSDACGSLRVKPTVTPSTATPNTFQQVTLTATATDPNGSCPLRLQSAPFTFAWALVGQPPLGNGATFSSSAATALLKPLSPGDYDVRLVATGHDGVQSAPVVTRVTAQQCGANAPVLSGFAAQQAASGLSAPATLNASQDVALSAVVSDADTSCGAPAPSFTYQWFLVTRPAGSNAALTSATAASPHVVPDLGGPYAVQVQVTDDTGLSATLAGSFTVSSTCGTNAPLVQGFTAVQTLASGATQTSTSAAPIVLDLNQPINVTPAVHDTDADAPCNIVQPVRYAWSIKARPAGSRAALFNATSATAGFLPDATGTFTLSLTVTDSSGLSSTSTFDLSIQCGAAGPQIVDDAGNRLPAFKAMQVLPLVNTTGGAAPSFTIVHSTLGAALPDQNAAVSFYPGVPVQLSANAVDADNSCGGLTQQLSYQWNFTRQPAGSIAFFTNPAALSPSFVPDLPGEYDVQLTVSDGTGRSATAVFASAALVGVSSCGAQLPTALIALTAPVTAPAPATAQVLFTTATIAFDGAASSTPDTQALDTTTGLGCGLSPTLSYQWSLSSLPGGSTDNLVNPTRVNPVLTPQTDGIYGVQLVVSDGKHQSFPARVSLRASSPDLFKSSFTASPNSGIKAGGVEFALITLIARDGLNNPIAAVPVTLIGNGQGASLSGYAPVTPVSGTVTATFSSLKTSGNHTVDALLGTLAMPQLSIGFIPGDASKLSFITQPSQVNQNNIITPAPQVQITDANDNLILTTQPGASDSTVTVSLVETTPAGVQLTGSTTGSSASTPRFVSFSGLRVTKQGTFHLKASGSYPTGNPLAQVISQPFNVIAPPTPNTGATNVVATGGLQQVVVTWNHSPDVNIVGYNVYRSQPPSTATTLVNTQPVADKATPVSYTDTGLQDGTRYAYQVSILNTAVIPEGPKSNITAASTTNTAPPAPVITSLTAANAQVQISWNTASLAADYNVYRSTSATGPFAAVVNVLSGSANCTAASCSFNDTGVVNGTGYYYVVGAHNVGGEQKSDVAGPVTPTIAPDPAHSNLGLAPQSANPPIADNSTANGAQLVVLVAGSDGAPIGSSPVSLTSSDGADTFTSSSGLTAVDGTFTTTLKSNVAETKTVRAIVGPPGSQITLKLVVDFVGTATATKLVFVAQPSGVTSGRAFAVTVAAEDANNNPVTGAGNVTLTIKSGSGTSGANLTGTLTQPLVSGVASFSNLAIDLAGTGYKLHAVLDTPGKNVDSSAFTVTAPATAAAYTALSSSLHSCTVKSDGTLWCWGPGSAGQLGNAVASSNAPLQVGAATNWTAVSTGAAFTCGIRGGALYCFGDNQFGQLGQGATDATAHATPLQVGVATNWASVTAGDTHACALDTTGKLFCWGNNASGRTGITAVTAVDQQQAVGTSCFGFGKSGGSEPIRLLQTFTPAVSGNLTAATYGVYRGSGTFTTSVFLTVNTVNSSGVPSQISQLGFSNFLPSSSLQPQGSGPQLFTFDAPGVPLVAGTTYALVLEEQSAQASGDATVCGNPSGTDYPGTLYGVFTGGGGLVTASGDVQFTTTMQSTPATVLVPTQVGNASWTSVSAGAQHTCGIQGGGLSCWGDSASAQAGPNGGTVASPTAVDANTDWTSVDAGGFHTCGIRNVGGTSQQLFCFGASGSGQSGGTVGTTVVGPTRVGAATDWAQVSAGYDHTCARHTGNTVDCFGESNQGQLGSGPLAHTATPTPVSGGHLFSTLSAGTTLTCALDTAGATWCWGNNAQSGLGLGGGFTAANFDTPQAAFDAATGPTSLASSANSSISASRAVLAAGGSSVITVVVRDASNSAVNNQRVTLSAPGATLSPSSAVTDGAGVVTATVTSGAPAAITVSALINSFTISTQVTFTAGPATAGTVALTVNPTTVKADGSLVTLSVHATDSASNPLAGATVRFNVGGSARVVDAPAGFLNATGDYSTTLHSLAAEVDSVSVSVQSITTATQTVTFIGAPARLAFTSQPQTSTSGSPVGTVTVSVLDSAGTLVPDAAVPVAFAIGNNPGGATLSGTTSTTSVSGAATVSNLVVSASGVGYTLVASSAGLTSATSSSFNITDPWVVGAPFGGTVTALAVKQVSGSTASAVAYAGTATGVFKTSDTGASWTAVRKGMGTRPVYVLVAKAADDSDTVYAGTNNGFYRSTDGGANWSQPSGIPAGIDIKSISTTQDSSSTRVMAVGPSAIYVSSDSGATFATVRTITGPGYIAISNGNQSRAYFVYTDGSEAARTSDSGSTWITGGQGSQGIALPGGSNAPNAVTALISSAGGGFMYLLSQTRGLYVYTTGNNGGWSRPNDNSFGSSVPRSIARDANNNLWAGFDDGTVKKSTNGGDDWTSQSSGLPGQPVLAVREDKATESGGDGKTLWAGQSLTGVYRAADVSSGWAQVDNGLTAAQVTALLYASSSTIYAGVSGLGVQRSTDSGATWATLAGAGGTFVRGLAQDATNNIVYAATDGGLFKSILGAAFVTGNLGGDVLAVAVDPVTHAVYAGRSGGASISIDTATTFTAVPNTGLGGNTRVQALAVTQAGKVYAGTPLGVFSSSSPVTAWTASTGTMTDVRSLAVDPITPANVYAGAGNGAFFSVDSGATFSSSSVTQATNAVIVAPSGGHVFAGTAAGIFSATANAFVNNGLVDTNTLSLAMDPNSVSTLYAGSNASSAAKTTSGGL